MLPVLKPSILISLLCIFVVISFNFTKCYNLSPKPNAIIKDPQFRTAMPKYESSYFGFSLNLRPNGVIIGAPRAQSTLESQRKVNETGAIYRCSLDPKPSCRLYVFNVHGNRMIEDNEYTYDSEKRDFQWLGASMDGGLKDTDKLIVCAPRFVAPVADIDYLMHGICYWINDTLTNIPTNINKISPLRLKRDQIRRDRGERIYYYILAEQGLSVHITSDNEEFLMGAPGIHTWKGSVIRYHKRSTYDNLKVSRRDIKEYGWDIPNPAKFQQPNDSYFGYSVSSGYFDSNNRKRIMYVATAPQANVQSGEAYIFDYQGDSITKSYIFRGQQFGEYFGYAVLGEDVNGDGLTDVIVSAPQHSISGSVDDGAIYIFINQGRFNFERKLIISPLFGKSRFGTTLTRLGDINHDGYNDIAVGAPFANDGSVFVYLGSASGLHNRPSQRIDSPKEFINSSYKTHMFGHGLSKGCDIDNNGFNDFAIGAPNAETVLLYKAYPVVKVFATIKSLSREIKPDQTLFPLTVCYSMSTTSTKIHSQELALHVVIDPQVKRVKILSNGKNAIKFNTDATTQTQCRNLDCNITFSESDIFKPIEMELYYSVVNQVPDSEVFCEVCAAVDPFEPKVYTEKIIYSTGCEHEICIADMHVKSSGFNYSYILGSNDTFTVIYDVTNSGETAYLPQINITSSTRMPFAKYPSNCIVNFAVMLCDLNHGQAMGKGSKDTLTVTYDVSGLSGTAMLLTAKVFSTGKELNPANNIVKDVITLIEYTEIEVVGSNMTPSINLEEDSNSAEVINFYDIKSNGPSNVGAMEVIFNIPVAYRISNSSATIPIIDMNNIEMQAIYDSQLVGIDFYQNNTQLIMNPTSTIDKVLSSISKSIIESNNEINYNVNNMANYFLMTASVNHNRKRRDASTLTAKKDQYDRIVKSKLYDSLSDNLKGTLPVNRTIVFNCNDHEMTVCVKAVAEVYNFKPGMPITVNMKYNIDVNEVNQILVKPWEFFVVLISVDVVKTNGLPSSLVVAKKIYPNIISKYQMYVTPPWVIILAVLGGILVLALLTYGMYKAGFFKRAAKEEMDRLLHQAKISRNSVTEASNLNA